MKFDKETIVVVLVAAVALLGWYFVYPMYQMKQMQQQVAAQDQAALSSRNAPPQTPAVPQASSPVAATPAAPVPSALPQTPAVPFSAPAPHDSKIYTLSNDFLAINFDEQGISSAELKKLQRSDDKKQDIRIGGQAPWKTFQLHFPETVKLLSITTSQISSTSLRRTFQYQDTASGIPFEVLLEMELNPNDYTMSAGYSFVNRGKQALTLPAFSISAAGLPPLKYLSGDNLYNDPHNVDYSLAGKKSVVAVDPAAKDEKFKKNETDSPVDWIGSSNKYFAELLFAKTAFNAGVKLVRNEFPVPDKKDDNYYVPAIAGVYQNVTLQPGREEAFLFTYYCGPKEISRIQQLPETAMEVMHLSYFSVMNVIARPLLKLLNYLKSLCGSYGWAIIILTIIVRVVFWPVTQKANNSMRRMQKIQPLVTNLREKYKDNPQELNMKIMELYKIEKVNPLGGCLPILLQLPVFFALYSALDASVELRQVSFWWASDLSKPDLIGPTFYMPFMGQIGIHPFALMMTALMVVQQKMTPGMGDPMQRKMMMLMPVIMLFMLYNLPSGLTLYWTVSQIFSILQLKYSQYLAKREEEKTSSPEKKTA